MKQFKVLLLTCSLIALPLAATAAAHNHYRYSDTSTKKNHEYYIRGNLGLPFYRKVKKGFQDSTRFMPHGNVAVGMRYKKVGAEVEGGYLYFKTKSTLVGTFQTRSSLSSKTLFLNLLFYPTSLHSKLNVYAGAGVGRAFNATANRYSYFKNTRLLVATGLKVGNTAFQAMAGGEYILNSKFSMLADIRYIYLGKLKQRYKNSADSTIEKLSIGTFTVGAKYKF